MRERSVAPRIQRIGAEQAPVIIIDDFFPGAGNLVDIAAQAKFSPVQGHLYPGLRARAPDAYVVGLVSCLKETILDVFDMRDCEPAGAECSFSLVTTPPEKLSVFQCLPHIDTTDLKLIAALHYLCPADRGGTSFYRHRDTGFEVISPARQETYLKSLGAGLKAAGPPERNYISGDTGLFERIAKIDAAFNRLIIYRSASLHSGDTRACGFSADPRSGRLTANTFLHFRERTNRRSGA